MSHGCPTYYGPFRAWNISKNVFFAGDLPDATDVAGIIRISAVNQERIIYVWAIAGCCRMLAETRAASGSILRFRQHLNISGNIACSGELQVFHRGIRIITPY